MPDPSTAPTAPDDREDRRPLRVGPAESGWFWECLALDCRQASYGLPDPGTAWQAAREHACTDPVTAGTATTDPEVLTVGVAAGWADPETDPADIDWAPRQAAALIPFEVHAGRPVTPGPASGTYGRAGLGRWGENPMCDAIVTCWVDGLRYLLLVARGDGAGWALPGGSIEPGETPLAATVRELAEETGLRLEDPGAWTVQAPTWVPDPRGTDESWAVTAPARAHLGDLTALPDVVGGDDARQAAWIPAPDYLGLLDALAERAASTGHGARRVFSAHHGLLLTELVLNPEERS